jgi:hypothetical protein
VPIAPSQERSNRSSQWWPGLHAHSDPNPSRRFATAATTLVPNSSARLAAAGGARLKGKSPPIIERWRTFPWPEPRRTPDPQEGKTIVQAASLFNQLLQHFPRNEFGALVKKHNAERPAKGFTCWTQFVSMLFRQFGRVDSLREICNGLACCLGKLVHLGILKAPRRSTLSYANEYRPAAFSLVFVLPSPASAAACPALFDRLTGTTTKSDSSAPCMSGFGCVPSRTGLDRPGEAEVSRFSCMLFLSVLGVYDYVEPASASRSTASAVWPSPSVHGVGVPLEDFRSSIPGPPIPLSTLQRAPCDTRCKTRSPDGSLLLSGRTLSFPTTCRFIPALGRYPQIPLRRAAVVFPRSLLLLGSR